MMFLISILVLSAISKWSPEVTYQADNLRRIESTFSQLLEIVKANPDNLADTNLGNTIVKFKILSKAIHDVRMLLESLYFDEIEDYPEWQDKAFEDMVRAGFSTK